QLLKFFRLVRRPGLKRDHLFERRGLQGGSARVSSKVLVEKNRKHVGGNIEYRGVEQVCPVGGKPGARAADRANATDRKRWLRGRQGSKSELLAERNRRNITSGLLSFWG